MNELPFAIALVAGMLAVLNPCGFALLPGYLALLVAAEDDADAGGVGRRVRSLGRALGTTLAMTGGFVAVFAGFGLVVAPLALSVERYLPWVTVVIGLVLIGVGGWLLSGRDITLLLPKPTPGKPTRSLRWAATYGVSYALASLSCTIGPFLALTASALRSTSALGAVGVFLAYAAGMGLVIAVLTIGAALARDTLAMRLRRSLPVVNRVSGALLVLAGAYVAYYGWFEIRVLANGSVDDPVIEAATGVQAELARWLDAAGPAWVLVALVALVALATVIGVWRGRRRRATTVSPAE
ncbi:cytochrome c biogenesis CcdA family protein [Salinactinospora qingdaonensis]|uniref:Cytochrome c biogenesis CcdA family protein n=1 Tax=Salinactinospora qingdaonensis TaxID=702744 RepID=A0ABP7G9W0_9ACTN